MTRPGAQTNLPRSVANSRFASSSPAIPRRDWLKAAVALPLAISGRIAVAAPEPLPVAAVVSVYKENSHADVIVGKILEGFDQQGGPGPGLRLAALYADQVPASDLSRKLAAKHGFSISPTIDHALTLGKGQLQVRGVLSIGEHGDYPYDQHTGQHMYPRRRFFDQIVATFQRVGQVCPVFNDKHLSYRWDDARAMYDLARKLQFPFMAGSSLPVAWRYPPTEMPQGSQLEDVVAVGYGGIESYGFHALEALQCLVERRAGGEVGVASVQTVQGRALQDVLKRREGKPDLFASVLATFPDPPGENAAERLASDAACFLVNYRDGLQAKVVMANGVARHFGVAWKQKDVELPTATWFRLEEDKPFGHFAYLVRAIEAMIATGHASYPVERTLLTTGILDAAMHSLADQHKLLPTPHLDVSYQPVDWPYANG